MKHFFKSKRVRGAATSTTQGSATVTGGISSESAANSAGASTNLAEISEALDPLLNALNEDGAYTGVLPPGTWQRAKFATERLGIAAENVASRLRHVCEAYPQSQIPESLSQWTWSDPVYCCT